MRLDEFLSDVAVFEVTDYKKTSGGKEICLGRTTSEEQAADCWCHMFGSVLMAQRNEDEPFLSVSKQYSIKGGALVYKWKVVCTDTDKLALVMPRIDKTMEAQRRHQQVVNPDGTGSATLFGMDGLEAGPQPEDYGFGSDIKR
jgi:hypothetical protein